MSYHPILPRDTDKCVECGVAFASFYEEKTEGVPYFLDPKQFVYHDKINIKKDFTGQEDYDTSEEPRCYKCTKIDLKKLFH